MLTLLVTAIFGISMLMAAYKDLTSYTIPNWISLLMIGGFLILAPFLGLSWSDFGLHILVFFGSLIITMAMFAMRWLGGGDAKFFAATALWWVPEDLLTYALIMALAGGLLTLIILLIRNTLPISIRTSGWVHRLLRDEKKIPYGLALAAAGLVTLPMSQIYLQIVG